MTTFTTGQGTHHYTLLDRIGEGRMAEVYTCKRIERGGAEQLIVLKILHSKLAQHSEIASDFIDQARFAALLAHENIATIHDCGERNGCSFIAMEYLFGKDLQSILQRAGETGKLMDAELALMVALKICEAMAYAHTVKDPQQQPLKVIHRHLNPSNVFITYEGKVKILNFGIVEAQPSKNRALVDVANGTSSYMSPEQLAGDDIDHRSDIFAIATLLYEMLSGRRPYSGDMSTLIRKPMALEYIPLETVLPGLQPEVYSVVHTGLAQDRNLRYQSCRDMGEALAECLFTAARKPTIQRLKEYIRGQFKVEFEAEKASLFAVAGRWGKSSRPMEFDRHRVDRLLMSESAIVDKPSFHERSTARSSRRWVGLFAGLLLSIVALGVVCFIASLLFLSV